MFEQDAHELNTKQMLSLVMSPRNVAVGLQIQEIPIASKLTFLMMIHSTVFMASDALTLSEDSQGFVLDADWVRTAMKENCNFMFSRKCCTEEIFYNLVLIARFRFQESIQHPHRDLGWKHSVRSWGEFRSIPSYWIRRSPKNEPSFCSVWPSWLASTEAWHPWWRLHSTQQVHVLLWCWYANHSKSCLNGSFI